MNTPRLRTLQISLLLAITTLQTGCLSVRYDVDRLTDKARIATDTEVAEHFERMDELSATIAGLALTVDPIEAQRVAEVAMNYPLSLASSYKLTQPAITHNMLVNMGARPRGLCVHWTEDLLRRLHELDLTTLDLFWGVAYPTKPMRLEHSSPVVVAKGGAFDSGILLDGWRDSGRLYFNNVPDDKRYAWQRLHNNITDPAPQTAVTP